MAWFTIADSSVHSISSPGQEAASLLICCSDATLSERLSSRRTRGKSSLPGRQTAYCHVSLSGMMSDLSAPIIRILRTISTGSGTSGTGSSSQGDSHARKCPSQGREPDWKARAQGYGLRCRGSLARYDRAMSSWRTLQCSLFEDSTESLEALPSSAIVSRGLLSELTMQGPLTDASGSGDGESWATPTTMDSLPPKSEKALMHEAEVRPGRAKPNNLRDQVANMHLWPTPTANEDAAGTPGGAMQWMLSHAAESGFRTEREYEAVYGPRRPHRTGRGSAPRRDTR